MGKLTDPVPKRDRNPKSTRSQRKRVPAEQRGLPPQGCAQFRTTPRHGVGVPILRIVIDLNRAIEHDKEIWIPGSALISDSDGYLVAARKANADELAWYLRVLIAEATLTMYQIQVDTENWIISLSRID